MELSITDAKKNAWTSLYHILPISSIIIFTDSAPLWVAAGKKIIYFRPCSAWQLAVPHERSTTTLNLDFSN